MTVTAAAGFVAAGVAAGIKSPGASDLAIVLAERKAVPAAGVFTRNRAAAAPVILSRRRLAGGTTRAVVLNSGCANAGTGEEGLTDAEAVTAATADLLGARPEEILMCSTGPIGSRLPVDRVVGALPGLVAAADRQGGEEAAGAILTTDSTAKTALATGPGFIVGGMAKGAAMLRPDMATMLCVLTTDARASAADLATVLQRAVPLTFNSLNVDGCESTNDSVIFLASGVAPPAGVAELAGPVEQVCRMLARQMAADAEGATRVVMLRVAGAADDGAARDLGRVVADSVLVRSSFYGGDPNWGRILAALGTRAVDPLGVAISYEGVPVAAGGSAVTYDEDKVAGLLAGDFTVEITVGEGPGEALVVTTDLTPEYVRFNGERS
jgi:glutamate N-acetyltransferase/amino-acid N-acetyltransferase